MFAQIWLSLKANSGADPESIEPEGANCIKYQTEPEGVPISFLYYNVCIITFWITFIL